MTTTMTVSRLVDTCVVAALLLLSFGCLVGPVLDADLREQGVLLPVIGLFVLGVALALAQIRLARPDPRRRVIADGAGIAVGLRPTAPRVMIVIGVAGSLLFVTALLGLGVGGGGLLFLPLVLLFLVLVPDAVRALARRPRVVLSPGGLSLHGWTVDSELAWDDVTAVVAEEGNRPRVVVAGRDGAASWRTASHRLLVPLEHAPRRPEIVVLASALDEPTRFEVLARRLAVAPAAERAGYLGSDGVAFLSGEGLRDGP